jgi:hypothetical protein
MFCEVKLAHIYNSRKVAYNICKRSAEAVRFPTDIVAKQSKVSCNVGSYAERFLRFLIILAHGPVRFLQGVTKRCRLSLLTQ